MAELHENGKTSNKIRPAELSTRALAYLGDSVMELCVRTKLVERGLGDAGALNRASLEYVRASAQAEAAKRLLPVLTEEETTVFHRGRNVGHTNVPKSATVAQYRMATGLEALFGYLHITGQRARIGELFALAYPESDAPES